MIPTMPESQEHRENQTAQDRPRVYLEEDCPVAETGIECQREGGVGLHPPPNRLHVWWARRPLAVSRLAVLGSLLPAGYPKEDFLALMGIPRGADPVGARIKIDEVRAGIRKERVKDPYGYSRAFTYTPKPQEIERLKQSCKELWGTDTPTVLDSFAGGGSIPFEAYRLGFNVVLNELNPVACVIERATIEYPALFGPGLAKDIDIWGNRIADEIEQQLADCFPRQPGEKDLCYIWVRTVTCPACELSVPLSPNWWLDKAAKLGYAMQVPRHAESDTVSFTMKLRSSEFDPDAGTVVRGVGTCPRCAAVLEGDHIKTEAQAGRMGHQLAAIGYKMANKRGRHFREVTAADLEGVARAQRLLAERLPDWEARGLVPIETRFVGPADRSANYGVITMRDLFSPRQLLVHLTTLEAILGQPWHEVADEKRREALRVYMAFVMSKALSYNSFQSRWDPVNFKITNLFERHDFAFRWCPGEIDGAKQLWVWALSNVIDSIKGLVKISGQLKDSRYTQYNSDAGDLLNISSNSLETIVIDPPYYDNVMYAELADFFYVWMKRSLGDVFPELFTTELTEKDAEAVANVARFKSVGRGKGRGLAEADYEAKMAAAFRECHRVLKDEGVLTIMFTHKKVEAWDTLAMALMEAGFEITASWPIHTESEHSLHQAKKNAAASTILLVCRKRPEAPPAGSQKQVVWWEDLQHSLDERVRERAEHFTRQGLRGQDVSIACFGPALHVVSEHWPVRTRDGVTIKPDVALDRARTVVSEWFIDQITEGKGRAVDNQTRFYVLAWYIFKARVFPYDEGRKLGISVGVDVDELISHGVITKKGNNIALAKPNERARKGKLRPDAKTYPWDLDYVQAAIHAYEVGQSVELTRYHQRTGAHDYEGGQEQPGWQLLAEEVEFVLAHDIYLLW